MRRRFQVALRIFDRLLAGLAGLAPSAQPVCAGGADGAGAWAKGHYGASDSARRRGWHVAP